MSTIDTTWFRRATTATLKDEVRFAEYFIDVGCTNYRNHNCASWPLDAGVPILSILALANAELARRIPQGDAAAGGPEQ